MAKQSTRGDTPPPPTPTAEGEQLSDIILILDKKELQLRAVSEIDENGNHQSVPADKKHQNSFLKLDRFSNIFESFLKNFWSQVKDPTHTGLLTIKESELNEPKNRQAIEDIAQGKQTDAVKEFLDKYEVKPRTQEQSINNQNDETMAKQSQQPQPAPVGENNQPQQSAARYNESMINWEELKNFGLSKEFLQEKGLLDQMLKGYKTNPIAKPVAHISLDFSAQDKEKLTNSKMIEIAQDYMAKMGYGNTQVLMVRHSDREHPHMHLILNRVDFTGKRISDQNERFRSTQVCKELTLKHGLYMSSGKENVKRHRLRDPDATKYQIYDALVKNVPLSASWGELERRLKAEGIEVGFKTKGSTSLIEGVRFTANDLTFNGSKVDKQFSYSKIDFALRQNNRAKQQLYSRVQQIQSQPPQHGFTSTDSDGLLSGVGGLFDDLLTANSANDPEEDEFRRRMQRKKKKRRGFGL